MNNNLVFQGDNSANLVAVADAVTKKFETAMRLAKCFNQSTLAPADYQGEKNLANGVIACNLACSMGADPMLVMQNLHIIKGRPSWSANFLISSLNHCGKFTPLEYEEVGDPMKPGWGVRAYAFKIVNGQVGERVNGTWITTELVRGEGWDSKPGSKWKTMPSQMARYRAGCFFQRVDAPEISFGMLSTDEARDIADGGYAEEVAAEPEHLPAASPVQEPDHIPASAKVQSAADPIPAGRKVAEPIATPQEASSPAPTQAAKPANSNSCPF